MSLTDGGFFILQFRLPLHRFYPVQVHHKQKIYSNYSWMHLLWAPVGSEPIIFEKSQFFALENTTATPHHVQVKSFEEARERNVYLSDTSVVCLSKAAAAYDLLYFQGARHHCLISEPLKNALVASGITGIEIIDAPINSVEV